MPSAARPASVGSITSRMIRAKSSGVTTGAGEYAPMPPVFGPVSPSPRRLWSCDVASGSTCLPSAMTMKLASSPSRNSSTTMTRPASPNSPANMPSAAAMASAAPGVAEIAREHALGCADGVVGTRGDDHALSCGEPVRLDHDRRALRADRRRIECLARECGVTRSRDAVAHQEFLGELLAALEPGRELARPEAGEARGLERVHDACDQRTFRAHDREAGALGARERNEAGDVRRGDRGISALWLERSAGVARRDDHLGHARRLRKLPGQ